MPAACALARKAPFFMCIVCIHFSVTLLTPMNTVVTLTTVGYAVFHKAS